MNNIVDNNNYIRYIVDIFNMYGGYDLCNLDNVIQWMCCNIILCNPCMAIL